MDCILGKVQQVEMASMQLSETHCARRELFTSPGCPQGCPQ